MDEEKQAGQSPEESKPSYTPASRGKRIAAWIGIVAMVILVLMYTYSIATGAILRW